MLSPGGWLSWMKSTSSDGNAGRWQRVKIWGQLRFHSLPAAVMDLFSPRESVCAWRGETKASSELQVGRGDMSPPSGLLLQQTLHVVCSW